jgi:fructose-1,6-bisphosphatase/sedoheptulose 1,7-bisphosphatase-like protein
LQLEDTLIGFYREDTGEKLLAPDELVAALGAEVLARQNLEQQRQDKEFAEHRAELLAERLRSMGINPDEV